MDPFLSTNSARSSSTDLAQTSSAFEALQQKPSVDIFEECSENTRISLDSHTDIDSNQGLFGSESSEPIYEHFQDMGIDNTWHEPDHFAAAPLLSGDHMLSASLPPLPQPLDSYEGASFESRVAEAPSTSPSTTSANNMQLVLYKPPEDDQVKVPGMCGLQNLGNTCFMSAGLQCLAATPSLVRFFISESSLMFSNRKPSDSLPEAAASDMGPTHGPQINAKCDDEGNNKRQALTVNFARLLSDMWAGKHMSIRPSDFRISLGRLHRQFNNNVQHDCQEFLALLLDTLHEQLNTAGKSASPEKREEESPATSGTQEAIAGCSRQERCSSTEDHDCGGNGDWLETMSTPCSSALSPSKSSNVEVAMQLAKRQSFRPEKNSVEQQLHSSPATCSPTYSRKSLSPPPGSLRNSDGLLLPKGSEHLAGLNLQDILKEAKTSNVNVLAPQGEATPNNQIKFDSVKYGPSRHSLATAASTAPRAIRNLMLRDNPMLENPNNLHEECMEEDKPSEDPSCSKLESSQFTKRLKQTNILVAQQDGQATGTQSGKQASCSSPGSVHRSASEDEEEACANTYKRLKLGMSHIKNKEYDESAEVEMADGNLTDFVQDDADPALHASAQAHWREHLHANQSIIADTFQGQFRSTVVCSVCNHKSVTFEPFMYLSVPLPHAMERQYVVTLVPPCMELPAVRYLVQVNKTDTAEALKEELRRLADLDPLADLVVCEGLGNRVTRVLKPGDPMAKSSDRTLYVIEIPKSIEWPQQLMIGEEEPPVEEDPVVLGCEGPPSDFQMDIMDHKSGNISDLTGPASLGPYFGELTPTTSASTSPIPLPPPPSCSGPELSPSKEEESLPWPKCSICLDEIDLTRQPRKHGESCGCVLCDSCIQDCKMHQKLGESNLKCPVCQRVVDADKDFVVMSSINSKCKPSVWLMSVPVVFRVDIEGEEYNNQRSSVLHGHPRLLRLPNKVTGEQIYQAVQPFAPNQEFVLLLVGGQGLTCSRCVFTQHCKGCPITPDDVEVLFSINDMLAIRTTRSQPDQETVEHRSMEQRRKTTLTLHSCLEAFTQPEILDADNPWFCPNCKTNQCATKAISVWRYPDVLIVYLKRFVFHKNASIKLDDKVSFPLTGLVLKGANESPKSGGSVYNLFSCVCHRGSLTASGHYIAYTKHPRTNKWHLYNDEGVKDQSPKFEEDSCYVLFYHRQHSIAEVDRI